MAVRAHVGGKPLEVLSYNVSEDATPLDPGSMEGGHGEITLEGLTEDDDIFLRDEPVALYDSQRGRTSGAVSEVSVTQAQVTITADSVLGMLNSWHHIPVVNGTISDLVSAWFGAAEINTPVEYQDGIGNRPMVSAAHYDNLWDRFKLLMSAQQIEAALVDDVVVLRVPRKFEANSSRQISTGWTIGRGDTAEAVEIVYYDTWYFRNFEFYPRLMEICSHEPIIMQVGSDEIAEYALETSATLDAWPKNPIRVADSVPNEPATSSVYSVVGNDDLPIPAKMWNDYGGKLQISPHEDDPATIRVQIVGAAIPRLAPFRIAMSSGAGNYYNSLRLVGSGVAAIPLMQPLRTGASRSTTGNKIGLTVENPYVQTLSQAYTTGVKTAAAYSGLRAEISGQALDINSRYGIVDEFAEQAFGNAAGARVREGDSYYRIITANFGVDTMEYSAVIDNTISDFNKVWEGATLADVSTQWAGRTLADFSVAPLRRN